MTSRMGHGSVVCWVTLAIGHCQPGTGKTKYIYDFVYPSIHTLPADPGNGEISIGVTISTDDGSYSYSSVEYFLKPTRDHE